MGKTVITIEDDPQIAELIKLVLASDELEVIHYDDGRHGLAGVIFHQPDLVILDVQLPSLSGSDVYAAIRAHAQVGHTPIIMCSVQQQSFNDRVNFTRSEIDFYITKPFDIIALRDKINKVLEVNHWVVPNQPKAPKKETGTLSPIGDKLIGNGKKAASDDAKAQNPSSPTQLPPRDL